MRYNLEENKVSFEEKAEEQIKLKVKCQLLALAQQALNLSANAIIAFFIDCTFCSHANVSRTSNSLIAKSKIQSKVKKTS